MCRVCVKQPIIPWSAAVARETAKKKRYNGAGGSAQVNPSTSTPTLLRPFLLSINIYSGNGNVRTRSLFRPAKRRFASVRARLL